MKASKFFQSLQFRLIAIVTLIFLASNIVIVTVAMRLSTKSTNDSVDALLNAVAESASAKIKAQEEKNFRMLNALALSDFLKDENLPLREKCAQLTKIAKVSDEYENIGFYDLDGNGFTADGRAINLKRAYIDNAAVGKTTITDPAINPVTNVLFQIYAAPVYGDNGKPIGCISLNIYGDVLSKTIETISFGESDTHIQVISRTTGHTIASNNFEQVTSFQNVRRKRPAHLGPRDERRDRPPSFRNWRRKQDDRGLLSHSGNGLVGLWRLRVQGLLFGNRNDEKRHFSHFRNNAGHRLLRGRSGNVNQPKAAEGCQGRD